MKRDEAEPEKVWFNHSNRMECQSVEQDTVCQ